MNCTASKQWKWQSATIFTAVLVSATALIAATGSGCNTDGILILDSCRDGGPPDGGDAGDNGSGGNELPYCNN